MTKTTTLTTTSRTASTCRTERGGAPRGRSSSLPARTGCNRPQEPHTRRRTRRVAPASRGTPPRLRQRLLQRQPHRRRVLYCPRPCRALWRTRRRRLRPSPVQVSSPAVAAAGAGAGAARRDAGRRRRREGGTRCPASLLWRRSDLIWRKRRWAT